MSDIERVNEIERMIAEGRMSAAQVFTQMKQLLPSGKAPASGEVEPVYFYRDPAVHDENDWRQIPKETYEAYTSGKDSYFDRYEFQVFDTHPPAKVPEGWKLVPIEPTHEMYVAFKGSDSEELRQYGVDFSRLVKRFGRNYKTMLDATPTPQPAPSVPDSVKAEIQSILDDHENYCWPTGKGGECKCCGEWNPRRNERESHGHREGCEAFELFERKTDWKARLSALLTTTPQPADNWIKCSDRLPTEADDDYQGCVWARFEDGDIDLMESEEVEQTWDDDISITHWMPTGLKRPNPPAEGSE